MFASLSILALWGWFTAVQLCYRGACYSSCIVRGGLYKRGSLPTYIHVAGRAFMFREWLHTQQLSMFSEWLNEQYSLLILSLQATHSTLPIPPQPHPP